MSEAAPLPEAAESEAWPSRREIAAVLGCSVSAVSMLRAGAYDRPSSDLPVRYAALMRLVARNARRTTEDVLREVCLACPRESCAGCRIAELAP